MIGAAASRVQMYRAGQFQAYLLDQDADPDCEDDLRQFWVLATGTLVRPRVDFRRLSRALEKLTARHDCLRTRLDYVPSYGSDCQCAGDYSTILRND